MSCSGMTGCRTGASVGNAATSAGASAARLRHPAPDEQHCVSPRAGGEHVVDLLRREGVEVWPPSTKTRGDRTRRQTRLAPRVCCGEAPACFTRRRRRPHLGAARRGAPAPPPAPAARGGVSSSGRARGPGSLRSPRPVSAGCPALCPRLRQDSWQVNADDVSSRDRPKPHTLPPPRPSRPPEWLSSPRCHRPALLSHSVSK